MPTSSAKSASPQPNSPYRVSKSILIKPSFGQLTKPPKLPNYPKRSVSLSSSPQNPHPLFLILSANSSPQMFVLPAAPRHKRAGLALDIEVETGDRAA